jgi:hypothetical protein
MTYTASKSINLKAGLDIVVTVTYQPTVMDWEPILGYDLKEVKIVSNGKTIAKDGVATVCTPETQKLLGLPVQDTDVLVIGKTIISKLVHELKAQIDEAIAECYAQVEAEAGEETETTKEAKKEEARQIRQAQHIVKIAEATEEALMTEAEKVEYLKGYNNVVNEGGEGVLPVIVTKEAYAAAKKVLGHE